MKKVLAAAGCGLVAVCLIFAGCTHTDHTAEIEELEQLYGGGSSGSSSDVLQNVYDYQRDEEGSYVMNGDGGYQSTRPDYDSMFDYNSGYINTAPEPAGAAATLGYFMPGELTLDTAAWAAEAKLNYAEAAVDEDGNTVTEATWDEFDPAAEDNIHTGDTIYLPSRNCLTNGTSYNGYSFAGWIIVYESGSVSELYTPSEQVTIMANCTLYPCFADPSPDVSSWRATDSNSTFSDTFNHDGTSSGTLTLSTGFNTATCRFETKINSTGDYWFRMLDRYSITANTEYRAKIALTNYNSSAVTVNFGMSSGGYSFNGWNWNGTAGAESETVTVEPGATVMKDYTYTTSAANSNVIFMAQDSGGKGWLDTDGAVHLGVSIDFGLASDFDSDIEKEDEAVTISFSTPAGVSVSDTYTAPANYTVGDSISSSELPSASQLTDTNAGHLDNKTFAGWYVHEVNESTGAVSNTIVGASYRLASAEVTFIPYYHMYGSSSMVANSDPGRGCTTTYNNETWNGVASNASVSDLGGHSNSWACIVTQQSNQVVLDAPAEGGYATLGTAARTNTGFTFTSGDKFRFTKAVSFDPEDDNIEIYRFQNYGTGTIKLKACLTNSGVEMETSNTTKAVYICLAPGDTAEYVWSSEYGSASNTSMMISFEAQDAFTMDIGVTMAYITSSSTGGVDSSMTGIYEEMQSKGYGIASANLNTTTASESNFVACLTSNAEYDGLSPAAISAAALIADYDLGDAYISLIKND
ncbi:MAG: hypothetical protein LUD51_01960 [Clostridia bacterium]|nr:hypothetical protein [Clostridia bacterium]